MRLARRWLRPAIVVALLVVGGWAAWRVLGPEPTYAPDSPLAEQCDDVPATARRVTLRAEDGFELGAATVGPADAPVGVVLRQGAGQTICQWLPVADRVAADTGARVLLFDRRGFGSSPGDPALTAEPRDLLTAVGWLRERGVQQIALMASSMGNSVMFTALPDVSAPAPCAVIAVSPVLTAGDASGTLAPTPRPAARTVWATWETGNPSVADAAERLTRDAPTSHRVPVDTADHSIALVRNHPAAEDLIVAAVAGCSR